MISFILFLFFLCFGACIGSFLTMLTYRIPIGEDIVFKNSYCPKCNAKLTKKSLIPIVSYVMQKGKCLNCGNKISIRYPLIELVNTIAYCCLFLIFGFSFHTFLLCIFFSIILSIIVIDLESMEIPIYLQICLLIFAILHILINFEVDPLLSICSAVIYMAIGELARIIVEKIKKTDKVLGGGDSKLFALCGLILGLYNITYFLLLVGFFGFIFGMCWKIIKKEDIFPFAPAIVLSLFILVLKYYILEAV